MDMNKYLEGRRGLACLKNRKHITVAVEGDFCFFKMGSLMGLNHYRSDARTSVEHREALEKEREDRIKRTSRRI